MAGTRAISLAKKVKEKWTEKHRDVARKIFLEGGWTKTDCSILFGRMSINAKLAR